MNALEIGRSGEAITIVEKKQFEQISYGIRPMVFSCLHAFDLTGDREFQEKAALFASWLGVNNVTAKKIYDPENGRCFDGIDNTEKINLNSGAESTIEALLILQNIEKYEYANQKMINHFENEVRD